MKLLPAIIILLTNSFHFTTAFTVFQRSPFPTSIIQKSTSRIHLSEPANEDQVPSSKDNEITNATFQTTSTTSTTSQTQSTLFAKKELYVGESFERGQTIYSDLEASAELFVENEVEMEIEKKDALQTQDTMIDVNVVENAQNVMQTDQIETTTSDNNQEPVMEDAPSIVETKEEVEPLTGDSRGEETSMIEDTPSTTEEEAIEVESNVADVPYFISEEEEGLSEDDNVGDGKVIMAAERVEKALRYQVLAAEEAQKNFEEARAEAIRRAQALTPLKEQVAGKEKSKESNKESKDDDADRAEAILRTRMLLDEEMADEAATDDSLIGQIRAFLAPRKGGVKDTKGARKRSKFL